MGLEISKVLIFLSQWCLGHLQDQQLADYLERCKVGIVSGGVIVVKENIAPDPDDIYDEGDSSVTRYSMGSLHLFLGAFIELG